MADHPDTPLDERALWVQIAGEVAAYSRPVPTAEMWPQVLPPPPLGPLSALDDEWMAEQW
jgi:hypothetical protein